MEKSSGSPPSTAVARSIIRNKGRGYEVCVEVRGTAVRISYAAGRVRNANSDLVAAPVLTPELLHLDGVIFGCTALFPSPESGMGKLACVAVNTGAQAPQRHSLYDKQRNSQVLMKDLISCATNGKLLFL